MIMGYSRFPVGVLQLPDTSGQTETPIFRVTLDSRLAIRARHMFGKGKSGRGLSTRAPQELQVL